MFCVHSLRKSGKCTDIVKSLLQWRIALNTITRKGISWNGRSPGDRQAGVAVDFFEDCVQQKRFPCILSIFERGGTWSQKIPGGEGSPRGGGAVAPAPAG